MAYGIQNTETMKRGSDNPILTIRLNDAEHLRFWKLMDAAKERNPYAGKSDVVRELLGLNAPSVLTESEIKYFRTGNKRSVTLRPKNDEPYTLPLGSGGVPIASTSKQPIKVEKPNDLQLPQKKQRRA